MNSDDAQNLAGRGLALALRTVSEESLAGLRPGVVPEGIEPHDAHAGIAPPPLEAWGAAIAHANAPDTQMPPTWSSVVLESPRVPHIALVAGEFPQRLDVAALLENPLQWEETPKEGRHELRAWAHEQKTASSRLLAAGVLRVAGDADGCLEVLRQAKEAGASEMDHALMMGALAFDAGKPETARRYWETVPEGPARWHNLGLVALVTGAPSRHLFTRAAAGLNESDPWHHLAALCADVSTS
jgi:hypothetical protein